MMLWLTGRFDRGFHRRRITNMHFNDKDYTDDRNRMRELMLAGVRGKNELIRAGVSISAVYRYHYIDLKNVDKEVTEMGFFEMIWNRKENESVEAAVTMQPGLKKFFCKRMGMHVKVCRLTTCNLYGKCN